MLKENDFVMLIDTKGKKYIIELKKDNVFYFHKGKVLHNDLIGKPEGYIVYSSMNEKLIVLKPTLMEYNLYKLKRSSQVIYPKDAGQILVLGDIFPGANVLECGCGSGALSLYILRAIGEKGRLVSIDIREDMLEMTKRNIENYYRKPIQEIENLELKLSDIKQAEFPNEFFDRIIIDITDPWEVLHKIYKLLKDSGVACFWLPTVLQVFNLIDKIEKEFKNIFFLQGIYETLQREWQKKDLSLRPKDRMVAHTGFLIVIRKIKQ
ncbi:MAG: tRNA (adenine-N1)-methyltransferase [Endomicrobiia bacterium]